MPQVHAVGSLANPHERRQAERAAEHTARVHDDGDDGCREDGREYQPAAVQEGRIIVHENDHAQQANERDNADGIEQGKLLACHARTAAFVKLVGGPNVGEPCAR